MPRAPSEKMIEAEKLYKSGMPMVDIAKKLGISDGTVRSWKNRNNWDGNVKKNKCNVAKNEVDKNATLQKRKRGGQPHNQNAKGYSPNRKIPNPEKHGAYKPVFMDALYADEKELIDDIPKDEEALLIEQIQLYSIRERRILKAINKYMDLKGDVMVADVSRYEHKRQFKDDAEEEEYNRRQQEKIDRGDILPGKTYDITTHTQNKYQIIARLEQELSSVQNKKTKAIETLAKLHLEKQKLEGDTTANDVVKTWAEKVLAARGNGK